MKPVRLPAVVMALTTLAAQQANACAVCMGAADDTMTRGMQVGILVLLSIIGSVLLGLGGFIGYLVHRGHMYRSGKLAAS
ncbi:MAG: hypothetical protein HQ523_00065 [Lentisphaerae bacterium]|nr:hypothetical protein [Lentisphaerota bacterium]